MKADPDSSQFLGACQVIDLRHPEVSRVADQLRGDEEIETVRRCFEFVRDEIRPTSVWRFRTTESGNASFRRSTFPRFPKSSRV